jgi:LysR family transcriptional regulator, hypochlorite-specific transcription factor HypT
MEIVWLEDFMALSETGHFSRAAERRNITQPAFSRRVRTLEEWVGTPLFNRYTHRIELTNAGEQFKPIAEEVIRLVYLGREQARSAAQSAAETLRFASTHALSINFFPDWLRQIEERTALEATVSLVADNMAACERKILQGEAHFLLCHHHPSAATALDPKQFRWIDLGEDVLVPVSVPIEQGSTQPRHALPGTMEAPSSYLSYSATSGMGRIVAATQAQDAPPTWLTTVFTSHVATVLVAMARNGRGLAWLPQSLVQRFLETGELIRAGDEKWDIPIIIRIFRPRLRQSPTVEGFWAHVRDIYNVPSKEDPPVRPV